MQDEEKHFLGLNSSSQELGRLVLQDNWMPVTEVPVYLSIHFFCVFVVCGLSEAWDPRQEPLLLGGVGSAGCIWA